MTSIYNSLDNQELIVRINKLTPESKPLWGKMTVDQMVSHCQAPMDVAFGDLKLKSNLFLVLIGKIYKSKILNSPNFKKNSPTAPDFIRKDSYNFENEKLKLIQKTARFATEGSNAILNKRHPFFGEMTTDEWDRLQWMHLDHHLQQFGV